MPWSLDVTGPAKKDLARIPQNDRERIIRMVARLADDPGAVDLQKLAGREQQWRLRVGRWRVILELHNETGVIRVMRVLPRDTAYRD